MRYAPLILILICCCFFSSCSRSGMPDLRETYSYKSTKPFGASMAKQIIEGSFVSTETEISKESFTFFSGSSDTNAVYICISRNLYLNDEESQAIMDYVYTGNTVFLSAATIDTSLLTLLHSKSENNDWIFSLFNKMFFHSSVKLVKSLMEQTDSFSYYYKPFSNYFSELKGEHTKVTGYNAFGKPNSIILPWGKGRLLLHCDPRAFSNYFLLKNDNHVYLQNLLSLTPGSPDKVYWDDYYRNKNSRPKDDSFSGFSELLKYPPLAAAMWLFILLLLLYILFNTKRKQRIIPIVQKNKNSSIAFTETIARLYFQKKDNKNIADKMITYFHEFIRNKYFLIKTDHSSFVSALSRKSGVDAEETGNLLTLITHLEAREDVTDQELLKLNHYMQLFYKK